VCKNLPNVADTGNCGGQRCCQDDGRGNLGRRRFGSARWIRTAVDSDGFFSRGAPTGQLIVIIGSGQANRACRGDVGLCGALAPPVATLLPVGAAGATWGECGAVVVIFTPFQLPCGAKLEPAA
jgi:hypothetical protein